MGFSPSLDSQNSVLLSPVQNDGRELSVSWGSPSSNWSDIEPSSQLNRLDPGPELKAAGVRTVAVRSLSGSDGTEPDMAEVYLFVDNAAGRYLLSLTVDAPPEQVTAELALTALRQAGFSFR
jgi:hypothetical protein